MKPSLIYLNLLIIFVNLSLATCGKTNDCVKAIFHPGYDVDYDIDDWWALEKQPKDINNMQLVPRQFIKNPSFALARSPKEIGMLWHLHDTLTYKLNKIYSHSQIVKDENGNEHLINLDFGSWYETRNKGYILVNQKRYHHYLRATIDKRVIFEIDDLVKREGNSEYIDYFRLGERSFRLQTYIKNRPKTYFFESILTTYTPSSSEVELAPRSVFLQNQ